MNGPNVLLDQIRSQLQELRQSAEQEAVERARERERLRGIKIIRIPVLRGTGANPFTMGGNNVLVPQMPDQGWTWSLRHLVIEGMTRGGTPDAIQIVRASDQRILWELNGNQYAQTWSRGEIMLNAGEALFYQSVGTFNATGTITAHGAVWEAPAEQAAKLA